MNSAGRSSISSTFQHGLPDGYLSLNPRVKGGLFPLTQVPPALEASSRRYRLAGSFWRQSLTSFRIVFPYDLYWSLSSAAESIVGGSFWGGGGGQTGQSGRRYNTSRVRYTTTARHLVSRHLTTDGWLTVLHLSCLVFLSDKWCNPTESLAAVRTSWHLNTSSRHSHRARTAAVTNWRLYHRPLTVYLYSRQATTS